MKMKLIIACLALCSSMYAGPTVLALAGSTRADSHNKKLLKEAVKIAEQMGAEVTVIDLKDFPMPFYNADLEQSEGMPANVKKLRDLMIKSDAIIIASPQYNASIPALLKNTLDWASRSENATSSKEAYKGKKFAIMSTSPGVKGGAKGLVHLRAVIEDCGGEVIQQQISVGNAVTAFNPNGELANPDQQKDLVQEIQTLIKPS